MDDELPEIVSGSNFPKQYELLEANRELDVEVSQSTSKSPMLLHEEPKTTLCGFLNNCLKASTTPFIKNLLIPVPIS